MSCRTNRRGLPSIVKVPLSKPSQAPPSALTPSSPGTKAINFYRKDFSMPSLTMPFLLDNQSSKAHPPKFPTYRDFCLPRVKAEYQTAYDYYVGDNPSEYNRSGTRFLMCHHSSVFARNKVTGLVKVLARSCHLRFCPICNKSRERLIRRNVLDWIQNAKYPKMLTLTLKHSTEDLQSQIRRLYNCFRELRRLKLIKKRVSGGVWFFQIKKSKHDDCWHPHIHCLVTGGYVPKNELLRDWLRLTGDSPIVDIRLVKDRVGAVNDVAKYCARSCSILGLTNDEILEVDTALARRKICGTWGQARKQRLTQPLKYVQAEWQTIGSWAAVVGIMNVDDNAFAIYEAWSTGLPLPDGVSIEYVDDFRFGREVLSEIDIE
jgi:hypothetical protein